MVIVTFTVHETRKVESVSGDMTIAEIAASKRIGSNEKIYINGSPVENRQMKLRDIVGSATSCTFNVITKTNNAQ